MANFPFYHQLNAMDCGPTCLRMVAKYYGKHHNTDGIRQVAGFSKEGLYNHKKRLREHFQENHEDEELKYIL